MKFTFASILSIGLLSSPPLFAQIAQPAPVVHSISLHVEAVKAGSANQVTRSSAVHLTQAALHQTMSANTAVGQEQVSNQSEALAITLHNLGQRADAARVEWFFVAGPIKPDFAKPITQQEYIFDKGSLDVSLQGSGIQVVPAQSSAVTSVTNRTVSATLGGGRGLRHTSAGAPELTG